MPINNPIVTATMQIGHKEYKVYDLEILTVNHHVDSVDDREQIMIEFEFSGIRPEEPINETVDINLGGIQLGIKHDGPY